MFTRLAGVTAAFKAKRIDPSEERIIIIKFYSQRIKNFTKLC